jgi:hypothetical protein
MNLIILHVDDVSYEAESAFCNINKHCLQLIFIKEQNKLPREAKVMQKACHPRRTRCIHSQILDALYTAL